MTPCKQLSACARRAEKTWKVLEDAIHEINNHNASGLSFEELYRCISLFQLCLKKHMALACTLSWAHVPPGNSIANMPPISGSFPTLCMRSHAAAHPCLS
jgi:hypothetical protein